MSLIRQPENAVPHPGFKDYSLKGVHIGAHPDITNDQGDHLPMVVVEVDHSKDHWPLMSKVSNLKERIGAGEVMKNMALGIREVEKMIMELSKNQELPPVFAMQVLGLLFVVVNDTDEILKGLRRPDLYHPSMFQTNFFAPLAGEGPSNSAGEKHDLHKKNFNKVFMAEMNKLEKALMNILPDQIQPMIDQLRAGNFDLKTISQLIGQTSLELIFAGELSDNQKQTLITFINKVFNQAPGFTLLPDAAMSLATPLYFKKGQSHGIVNNIIKRRLMEKLEGKTPKRAPDVTDRFIEEYLKDQGIKPDHGVKNWSQAIRRQPELKRVFNLVNEASLNAFFGAADTTSGVLKSALVELALNPSIIDRLYAELTNIDQTARFDLGHYPEFLRFMYALLHKWGSVSKSGKSLVEETVIAGFPIPADSQLLLNLWQLGRGTEQYLNDKTPLEAFYPSEELGSVDLKRALTNLPAFGQQAHGYHADGSKIDLEEGRECPGRLLALHILLKFLLQVVASFQSLKLETEIEIPDGSTLHQEAKMTGIAR